MITDFIKKNTADFHDQTEAAFESNKIFNNTFTVEDYKRLLLHNYLLVKQYEDDVFQKIPKKFADEIGLESRRKLKALQQDLQALNLDLAENNKAEKIENVEEALGVLYVMEGSTLGGNVIARQLSKSPGFENVSFNYFGIYGAETGQKWTVFKDFLNQNFSEKQDESVLKGAQKAYQFLLSSLEVTKN